MNWFLEGKPKLGKTVSEVWAPFIDWTWFLIYATFLFSVNNVIYHPDEFVDANSIPRTYSSLANQSFTWKDWVLTTRPGYFGLIRGTAYPTGVAILVILLIMYICSMKWVRKGGYFEVLCVKESPKTALYLCQNSVATVGSFDAWKSKHSVT